MYTLASYTSPTRKRGNCLRFPRLRVGLVSHPIRYENSSRTVWCQGPRIHKLLVRQRTVPGQPVLDPTLLALVLTALGLLLLLTVLLSRTILLCEGQAKYIFVLEYSPDGHVLVFGGDENTVHLRDPEQEKQGK